MIEARSTTNLASAIQTIVVVEDDDEMLELVRSGIHNAGFRVIALSDGQQMLDFMVGMMAGTIRITPVAIISDIHMPGLSGIEVLSAMRSGGLSTPMILMTAFGHPYARDAADRLGATRVLYKPFRIAELLSVVSEAVGSASAGSQIST